LSDGPKSTAKVGVPPRRGGLFQRLKPALLWAWDHLDPLAALLAGAAATLAGLFGWLEGEELSTATLGVLVIVALALVHERTLRLSASERIDEVLAEVHKTRASVSVLDLGTPYHVIENDSMWDIHENGDAHARRRKLLRFAQDEVVSVVDWFRGDGEVTNITYLPGKPVHEFALDGRACTLVALDRPYVRDEEADFIVERDVKGVFTKTPDRIWVVTTDSTSLVRTGVRWPANRPPTAVRFFRKTDTERQKPVTVAPTLGADGRMEFVTEIQEPEPGERICIEWDWDPPQRPTVEGETTSLAEPATVD
jgi:hypothetical protein